LQRSLTVLLPVHNVESTLAADVTDILDAVSDLAERFELVIIDDGSADATSEVIDDLTRSYPQVWSLRHGEHRGRDEAIRSGLKYSTGELIFLREGAGAEKKAAHHMVNRKTMEQLYPVGQPASPADLPHLLTAAPAEPLGGIPAVGSQGA